MFTAKWLRKFWLEGSGVHGPDLLLTLPFAGLVSGKISNMRFGINTFLFTSPFTNESTRLFRTFKKWGFESVEIPIEDPSHIDPAFVKEELARHGLVCGSACACMGPGRDFR